MNRSSHPNSRSRKRSWSVVGSWLLPVVVITTTTTSTTASPFLQPYIPPARRRVLYASSSFVSSPADQSPSSWTKNSQEDGSTEDRLEAETIWFVHADAGRDHPDRVFAQIRNNPRSIRINNYVGLKQPDAQTSLPFSSWMSSYSSFWSWRGWKNSDNAILRRRIQVDETSPPYPAETNDHDENNNNDNNSTRTNSIGFNVTVDTEYNVTETVVLESNSTTNDTSTVVFTSNEQNNQTNASSSQQQQPSSPEEHAREFRPIRIRAFLSELTGGGQHLNDSERVILLQSILRPALLAWSAALRVEPVLGNLTVDPAQLVNGIACGPGGSLPSVVVPESHITTGVPETDFVLYISLAFTNAPGAQKNQTRTPAEEQPNDEDEEDSNFGFGVFTQKGKNTTAQTIEDLQTKHKCTGDFLAASAFCSTDQLDRPTAGILHLCITEEFFYPENLQTNIMLTMHELGHALGFNSVSLAHFRRWDGTPITPRDPETGEIPLVEIECTGPVGQRRRDTVALPSEEILQFRTVRGGVRVAEVVTPSVRQVARNHFDCQNLTGAELESGEFLPLSTNPGETSCIGDHWERRLFRSDLMNPIVDDTTVFSPLFSTITLAYFADSGFYQVDLTRASMAAWWGRAAGCAFVDETCIRPEDGQVPPAYDSLFCNQAPQQADQFGFLSELHGCTPDLSRKASCTIGNWEGELPPAYQYFNVTYGADVGGNDPFMDFCPVYAGFKNGLCSDPENEVYIKVNYVERIGRRNSRCLTASITENSAKTSEAPTPVPIETENTALCLPIACVVEDRSLQIQVNGIWEVCNKKGDIIFGSDGIDNGKILSIVCPDPIRICPTFYCKRDCLGTNRICDYNIGECVCNMTSPHAANDTILEWNNSDSFSNEQEYPGQPCSVNSSDPNFFKPEGAYDGKLPSPDSPLADYYVPRRRDLQEENGGFWSDPWKTGSVAGSAAVLFFFMAYLLFHALKRILFGGKTNNEGDDNLQPINPEKHKMIATILVDMRMHDPILQRRIDALGNRNSETDLSMTETEASADVQNTTRDSGVVCELELPTYGEGGISNLFGGGQSDDDTTLPRMSLTDDHEEYIDPLAPPVCTTPVVRRRHILFHNRY